MLPNRRPGIGDIVFLLWTVALCVWLNQYLPVGTLGSATLIAVAWTAFYSTAVSAGVPVMRYWLALVVGVLLVATLDLIKPSVPPQVRVATTAVILLASGIAVFVGRLRRARRRDQ